MLLGLCRSVTVRRVACEPVSLLRVGARVVAARLGGDIIGEALRQLLLGTSRLVLVHLEVLDEKLLGHLAEALRDNGCSQWSKAPLGRQTPFKLLEVLAASSMCQIRQSGSEALARSRPFFPSTVSSHAQRPRSRHERRDARPTSTHPPPYPPTPLSFAQHPVSRPPLRARPSVAPPIAAEHTRWRCDSTPFGCMHASSRPLLHPHCPRTRPGAHSDMGPTWLKLRAARR
mmetsp:Transcript_71248/g.158376  ORF Transcript_71248/g.158376 Transcript_71248/m.158376 type:complete len:230 (+) Transcript_71248:88-777(+)